MHSFLSYKIGKLIYLLEYRVSSEGEITDYKALQNGFNRDLIKIKKLLKAHNLNAEGLVPLLNGNSGIPVSIFKCNVGPLGALCVYLKDVKGLRFSEIARLLNRNQRTIWTTYAKAKPRVKQLKLNSSISIPIEVFGNRKLSIMENLVQYLVSAHHLRLVDIARMLDRSNKTVWCFHHRALKKNEG